MKKGLFTALFTLCFAALVSAQTPSAVTSAFNQAMPGVNATYVLQGNTWKANFTQGGNQMSFLYSPEGTYHSKETVIAKTAIPAPALQDMEARFNGFTYEGAAKVEMADGSIQYKYQYLTGNNHVEVFYGANGQMIRRAVYQ